MNRTTSLFLIGLLFLSACSSGSDFYKSSYPSYLKNGSTKKTSTPSHSKKISATERSENEFQFETKESSDNQVFSGGLSIQDSTNLKDNSDQLISQGTIEANGAVLYLPSESNDFDNHVALGNNQNMLTWSVPKTPIYSENGTLSEYRFIRESLSSSKIYIFKTPESTSDGSNFSVLFYSQTEPAGYKWTIETRCNLTTFECGNSIDCKPETSMDEEPSSGNNQNKKRLNRKSLLAVLMIPILFAAGIVAVFLLLSGPPLFLAGLLLVAIGIGCIVSIVKAVQGILEIKNSKGKQWGTGLSVLAILGSILGLILVGILIFFELIY